MRLDKNSRLGRVLLGFYKERSKLFYLNVSSDVLRWNEFCLYGISSLFTYRSSLRIILDYLLLSLYIHDLPPVCCGDVVKMYDDDIRIYCQIEMVSNHLARGDHTNY